MNFISQKIHDNVPLFYSCIITLFIVNHNHIFYLIFLSIISLISIPYKISKQFFLIFVIGLFFSFFVHYEISKRDLYIQDLVSSSITEVSGVCHYMSNFNGILIDKNGFKFYIKLNKNLLNSINPGDKVRVFGTYIPPSHSRNPGQFESYNYALNTKRIGRFTVDSYEIIQRNPYSLYRISGWLKQHIVDQHKSLLPYPFHVIYTALLFGESYSKLPQDIKNLFKDTGLLHALVVSGSQVSLLLSLCSLFCAFCHIYRHYQWIVLIPVSIIFYFVAGCGASIFRAILMALLLIFLKDGLKYKTSPIYILNVTWLIMLFLNPFVVFDNGAILSFLATFSLLYGVPIFESFLSKKIPSFVRQLITISIVPWLFTTPFLLVTYHQVSMSALICNILLLYIIELVVLIGFVATLFTFVHVNLGFLCHQFCMGCLIVMMKILECFSNHHLASFYVKESFFWLIISGCVLWLCINLKTSPLVKYSFIAICVTIFSFFITRQHEGVIITFLDVGQGDAIFIQFQDKTFLVDTGSSYDAFHGNVLHNVILPFCAVNGINKIDYLFISHFDEDHVGNLVGLMKHVKVNNIVHNGKLFSYLLLNDVFLPAYVNDLVLCDNDELSFDDLVFSFYQSCVLTTENKNDQSLVFKLRYEDESILFTGDIEVDAEEQLLLSHGNNLRSTILKIAHHGSKTSSSELFLRYVNPDISLISAGIVNYFGHPHSDIVNRLLLYGHVFQTNIHGAITIVLNGGVYIRSFLSEL